MSWPIYSTPFGNGGFFDFTPGAASETGSPFRAWGFGTRVESTHKVRMQCFIHDACIRYNFARAKTNYFLQVLADDGTRVKAVWTYD
jgi:hypothetical protein